MAELVDALDSKSSSGNRVWVRFPPEVLNVMIIFKKFFFCLIFTFNINFLFTQIEVKANLLSALALSPNFGIEISVGEKESLQLDVLASFWNKLNNSKTPLHLNQTFLEYRLYRKNDLSGMFIAPNIGYGMFNLKKPKFAIIFDPYGSSSYDNNTYHTGRVAFYGLTIGYKKRLNKRISLELFLGGGYSMANYKAYREDIRTDIRDNWRTFNRSGEFVFYKGGIMISYNFRPFNIKN